MSADEDEVRAANERFYAAFAERDAELMDDVWARASPAVCIHPGWAPLVGRMSVMESWRRILENPRSPAIECSDVTVLVYGASAIVICREAVAGQPPALVATNVFVREPDGWRMVHHQAGPVAPEEVPPPTPDRSLN